LLTFELQEWMIVMETVMLLIEIIVIIANNEWQRNDSFYICLTPIKLSMLDWMKTRLNEQSNEMID
jgi:hypothetical protein